MVKLEAYAATAETPLFAFFLLYHSMDNAITS
jgi:hypothetical protein